MPPRAHAILSPSSAERWINCPPSAIDNANAPRKDTAFTIEGTVAHALAEAKAGIEFGLWTPEKYSEEHEFIEVKDCYDADMERYTDRYTEHLREIYDSFEDSPTVYLETKLDFDRWVPESFGTADCVMVGMDDIHIIDFKYGKGVEVSAERNPQMMIYALGVLEKYGDLFDQSNIHMNIIQPRISSAPSTFDISRTELLEWADEVLKPAADLAFKGEGNRSCGDWCRWCCNNGKCRAQMDAFKDLPVEKQPNTLTPEELDRALELGELVSGWIDAVKSYALTSCLEGESVSGWKAVEGRSSRAWSDQSKAFEYARNNGIPDEMLYERKPLSVAALEKVVGRKRFGELMKDFVSKEPGKPTLVRETDKRDAIIRKTSASEDFQ